VLHTLKHFRPAYENRLKSLDFEPAFDLDGALARARQMTGCGGVTVLVLG